MYRRMILLACAAMFVAAVGCKHRCCKLKESCCPPSRSGANANMLLPPTSVPTVPGPSSPFPPPSVQPGPSGYLPPAAVPKSGGPDVLFPDPLPGGTSSRPVQPGGSFLGPPVKQQTTEPAKTAAAPVGLPAYTKVKDGLFTGGKPTLDGFDALKKAGFRTVIYLHDADDDVNAIKELASARDLNFIAIETTPETLSAATARFNRVTAEGINRPAYIFGSDTTRAGAAWYMHFRTADVLGDDVARLRAKPLGLSEQGEEGKAFAVAIQKLLEG